MAKSLQIKAFLFGLCVATWNLGSAVSASNVRHLLQSYDDTIGADSWRINSGLEAECDGTGYPTSNWGGQTYDAIFPYRSIFPLTRLLSVDINTIYRYLPYSWPCDDYLIMVPSVSLPGGSATSAATVSSSCRSELPSGEPPACNTFHGGETPKNSIAM